MSFTLPDDSSMQKVSLVLEYEIISRTLISATLGGGGGGGGGGGLYLALDSLIAFSQPQL